MNVDHRSDKLLESIEGPEAAARFDTLVRKVLSVPHEEITRREAEYQRQAAANSNRRGSKPGVLNHKPKRRASSAPEEAAL
jgi:hypothetical protein